MPQTCACIGIVLVGPDIRVAARAGGRAVAAGSLPAGALGAAALLGYLDDWEGPLRLAVATSGAAALNLALDAGIRTDREVFLVSAQSACAAADLARYAERAI